MIAQADQQGTRLAAGLGKRAVAIWNKAERTAKGLEDRPVLPLVLLLAVYVFCTLPQAYTRLLWHDELFTYNFALAPNLGAALRNARIDLNPPLLYLLEFFTVRLPGAGTSDQWMSVAARLPSLAAGLAASWAMFFLLRRRTGSVYALLGVCCFWSTPFLYYAQEDRPYALLTAFMTLLVAAWERATEPDRSWGWVAAVTGLGLLLVGTHFMGIFILPAFVAAELVRGWQRRKPDVPLIAAFVLPILAIAIYRSTFTRYGTTLFPQAFQRSAMTAVTVYVVLVAGCGIPLFGSLIFLVLKKAARFSSPSGKFPATLPEVLLLFGILLEPVIALAALKRSHGAFFPRYGLPACFSIAILTVALLWKCLRQSKSMALLVAAGLCCLPVWKAARILGTVAGVGNGTQALYRAGYESVEPSLPLVAASGLTYTEMNHREPPALLRRLYFLQDEAAEIQYAHATLFDAEGVVTSMFHFQSKVETLDAFEAEHPRFLVLGTMDYPEDWLLRKLAADGDTLRLVGHYDTTYKDHDLYEVTIRPSGARNIGDSSESR